MKFSVHFLSGFDNAKTTFLINDKEIFSEYINTDLMLGFAKSIDLSLPQGENKFEVIIHAKGLHKIFSNNIIDEKHLLISVIDDQIVCSFTTENIGFL